MGARQSRSALLVLTVIISALTSGLVGYYVALSALPAPSKPTGALGATLFLFTVNDTTVNRAFNTSYQNLQGTGSALNVQITANLTAGETNSSAISAFISLNPASATFANPFCNCYATTLQSHKPFVGVQYNITSTNGMVAQANFSTKPFSASTAPFKTSKVETIDFWVPSRFFYMVNNTESATSVRVKLIQWLETIPPTGFGTIISAVISETEKYGF